MTTTNHRLEAEGLIRSVREHGTTADYAVLAVAEAVLDLADALRSHQAPPGAVTPKPRPKPPTPTDGCQCGHTRAMHRAGAALGDLQSCRSTSCQCLDFRFLAEPWPTD